MPAATNENGNATGSLQGTVVPSGNTGAQQPGGNESTATIIGSNLALGTRSNATLGTYLIGFNGKAVYTKTGDTSTTSSCYETCAETWLPYIVGTQDNVDNVQAGITGKVAVISRTDGSLQVTYNGKPLYFYTGDTSTTVTGEGLGSGVWHVAKP
jgi:predicted lipoprotein with Yx(FWY)xxD motif